MGRVIRAQKKGTATSILKSQTPVIGTVLPLGAIPQGTIVCNVKHHLEDDDVFIRASRDYAKVIGHNPKKGTSRIKLPSGAKKIIPSDYFATIGQATGGGRTQKPLKAGNFLTKARGMARSTSEHPRGSGNSPHIGHASYGHIEHAATVRRNAPSAYQPVLIGYRRTGRLRGETVRQHEDAPLGCLRVEPARQHEDAPPSYKPGLISYRRMGRLRGETVRQHEDAAFGGRD